MPGSLIADRHAQPGAALDALVEAADVPHINLDHANRTPYLNPCSTDGTPVTYPGGAALLRAHAARLRWRIWPPPAPHPPRRTSGTMVDLTDPRPPRRSRVRDSGSPCEKAAAPIS